MDTACLRLDFSLLFCSNPEDWMQQGLKELLLPHRQLIWSYLLLMLRLFDGCQRRAGLFFLHLVVYRVFSRQRLWVAETLTGMRQCCRKAHFLWSQNQIIWFYQDLFHILGRT